MDGIGIEGEERVLKLEDIKKKLSEHQEPVVGPVEVLSPMNKLLECPVCLDEMSEDIPVQQRPPSLRGV